MDDMSNLLLREAEYNVTRARNTSDRRELQSIASTMNHILEKFDKVYDTHERNKRYNEMSHSHEVKALANQMRGEVIDLLADSK